MHLLAAADVGVLDGSGMDMPIRGRQLLGYGSGRANGYGGGHGDNGCDPALDDGCGVPGSTSSMMYQSLMDASDYTDTGSDVDAGDVF
jgi:hypothetical protein